MNAFMLKLKAKLLKKVDLKNLGCPPNKKAFPQMREGSCAPLLPYAGIVQIKLFGYESQALKVPLHEVERSYFVTIKDCAKRSLKCNR